MSFLGKNGGGNNGRAYSLVSMGVGKQPFGNSCNFINLRAAKWDKEDFRTVNLYFMVCRMVSPGMPNRNSVRNPFACSFGCRHADDRKLVFYRSKTVKFFYG